MNLAIIAANLAVFFLLQVPSEAFTYAFSTIPFEITSGTDLVGPQAIPLPDGTSETLVHQPGPSPIWLTLFSSMFMHGGYEHIFGNMLFLFIFGDNIEKALGMVKYAAFYLVCGVLASLAHVLSAPESTIPSLGASGAISGVLAAYLVFFPHNRVRVLMGFRYVTQVPALLMIGLWAVLQFVNGLSSIAVSAQTSGVAWFAHIGGFIAGAILAFLLRPTADRGTPTPVGTELWGGGSRRPI
ncbi:MAG TPA: rhomboid family intramembrane serine protease [Candidatus Limnocylindria bacterium]|nr:rhomboid family intramembrane serine protease [Candidatus Limnocylindria bacterium]